MPSSTFSFERAPAGASGRMFIVALAVAGLLLGGMETYLRSSHGHPSVALSNSLYAENLESGLANLDPRTTLLLGASRMRSGFSSRTFKERTDGAPLYYLATSGESPLALILYLAERTNFSGKLIVSLTAASLSGNSLNDQKYIVNYFEREWNWNQKLNHELGDLIASMFVFRQENYSVANVIRWVVMKHALPPVPYWRRNATNGESFYDFSLVRDRSLLRSPSRRNTAAQSNDLVWEHNLSLLKRAIAQLRDRDCQVALVRFPTSGNWWANDQERWPRAQYWDRLASSVGPITVHFQDVKGFQHFKLPDGSHIDTRDRDAFTRVLLDALIERGMVWQS